VTDRPVRDNIKQQLDQSDDPVAVILRAHLLVEVRLRVSWLVRPTRQRSFKRRD
jgi:hypothetical protein